MKMENSIKKKVYENSIKGKRHLKYYQHAKKKKKERKFSLKKKKNLIYQTNT